jgi:hypothetical protein
MQIEWSEGEVLKLAGVGTEAEEKAGEGVGARSDDRKRCDRGREVGIGSGAQNDNPYAPTACPLNGAA